MPAFVHSKANLRLEEVAITMSRSIEDFHKMVASLKLPDNKQLCYQFTDYVHTVLADQGPSF